MNDTTNKRDLKRILIEAITLQHSLFAWNSFNGVIEKCEMKLKAMRSDNKELEIEIAVKENKSLDDVMTGDRRFKFYLPEDSLAFEANLKVILGSKRMIVEIPGDYVFFERRRHERVTPAKTCYFSFEFKKHVYKKMLFDVSLGGVAILLPKVEKINFGDSLKFENCVLEIGARKIKVKAECVSVTFIDRYRFDYIPYGGNKVAFHFFDLAPEDKEFLVTFIATESMASKALKGA
jgi:hypothetical protein